jgi:hypothetical protein
MLSALTLYVFMLFVLFHPIEAMDDFFKVTRRRTSVDSTNITVVWCISV